MFKFRYDETKQYRVWFLLFPLIIVTFIVALILQGRMEQKLVKTPYRFARFEYEYQDTSSTGKVFRKSFGMAWKDHSKLTLYVQNDSIPLILIDGE